MLIKDLSREEIGDFYWRYIELNDPENSLEQALTLSKDEIADFFRTIPKEKWLYRYEHGKWSILEVIQHIIDTERIFQYRALAISRNEQKSLPGYDHDSYVDYSNSDDRDPESLIAEFETVRDSGIYLFRNFNETMLKRLGAMNENPATPRAIGFVICGHALHHRNIIKERYL